MALQELLGRLVVPDRTALSTIAQELEKQEQVADQAKRLAEMGSLVSAVAHEVRNPLGVLKAHLKLLQRKQVEPRTLEAMQEQIERAEHFVNDLLHYGRPRELEVRSLPVQAMMELATTTTLDGLRSPTQRIEVTCHETEPDLYMEADQSQLLQVLVILLENAIIALQQQDAPEIHLSCEATADSVTFRVEDNGPGIPEAIQENVLEVFVTGRKRDKTHTGTGLGLAIARGIVERHHGVIQTDSSSLGGACFVIELPRRQAVLSLTTPDPQPQE